jgi:outer membrane protein TolC
MTGIPELRPEDMERFVAGRFPHERATAEVVAQIERAVEAYRADLVQKIEALQAEAEAAASNPEYLAARRDYWAEAAAYDKVLGLIDGED